MAVYAVGDIQGCYKPLRRLLDKVGFDPAKDVLWCTGDMVNRGPDSLAVLRYLKSLGDACVCVLGNHEIQLLTLVASGASNKPGALDAFFKAKDRDELIDWLRSLPLLYHDVALSWCMVHAGFDPTWSLKKAKKYTAKVEKQLRGDDWQSFIRQLNEHETPLSDPQEKGLTRNIYTLCVLTQARYCTQEGSFDWISRSNNTDSAEGKPWFAHAKLKWKNDCSVVFGHWAARGLVADQPHVLGLDTGCVWGGALTLARLDHHKRRIISEPCEACRSIK